MEPSGPRPMGLVVNRNLEVLLVFRHVFFFSIVKDILHTKTYMPTHAQPPGRELKDCSNRGNPHPCPHHTPPLPVPPEVTTIWLLGIIVSIIFTICVCIPEDCSSVLSISVQVTIATHCLLALFLYSIQLHGYSLFILSAVHGHLHCFQCLATTNNAA